MALDECDLQITAARAEVLAWLQRRKPGWYDANGELALGFARFVAGQTDLELRTVRNPSSCHYEARWYHGGREASEFRKPFCAEREGDARLLACAAMLRLQITPAARRS
jgi:hypothetical protein